MDIFVQHVPPQSTQKRLQTWFAPHLGRFGIQHFHVEKMKNKPLATLTVLSERDAIRFLETHGVTPDSPRNARCRIPLTLAGKVVRCQKSKFPLDKVSLAALEHEAQVSAPTSALQRKPDQPSSKDTNLRSYPIASLDCGFWDYVDGQLTFSSYYSAHKAGRVLFGGTKVIILLPASGPTQSQRIRLDIDYHQCESIVLGSHQTPHATFSLFYPPKIWEEDDPSIATMLQGMNLFDPGVLPQKPAKVRVMGVDEAHTKIAGICVHYRVTFADKGLWSTFLHLLDGIKRLSSKIRYVAPTVRYSPSHLEKSLVRLAHELTDMNRYGKLPFTVRYQLQRLVSNTILSPSLATALLPAVQAAFTSHGLEATTSGLRKFYKTIPPAGPGYDAAARSIERLKEILQDSVADYNAHDPAEPYELTKRYKHVVLVHRVIVTPMGLYLEGPEPEPTNRVLRKHHDHTDHFIRLLFQDENGSTVRHDPSSSQERIYHLRFKGVLDKNILIAGRAFDFLGFSHSSLRAQSCWFMAPIVVGASLQFAPQIIKALGDFSRIRIPAKCAARIGQCFTDTTASVPLVPSEVGYLPMVQRNGRDFGDGVGTISIALWRAVCKVYGDRRLLKPTVLQIRFQGAKGVVSVDPRLTGRKLMLRENMKKFDSPGSWDLEICGAAFKPLPMVLNRSLIKILEDLGVPLAAFKTLQDEAVSRLYSLTSSGVNAATLLTGVEIPTAPKLPYLLEKIEEVGIDYRQDPFLNSVIQIAVLSQLRDIKYRGRIPVPQGHTLYGIMDETGYLREGEVYVVTETGPEGGRRELIRNNVIVSRSPALHPGDVQIVNAVTVPDDSILKSLANVVVFSQHGARDLPSQLSGGDLDGDLYNIIFDPQLMPRVTASAADYIAATPVTLDREVERKDMSDFFVKFMESDVLGFISNVHLQLSDQKETGTFDADCVKLAHMASIAVDYSKSGVRVDVRACPRYHRARPDFMAPSPRIVIEQGGFLDLVDLAEDNETEDLITELDSERPRMRYYKSQKALGHLYRAIDESRFLEDMQARRRLLQGRRQSSELGGRLLKYVLDWASQYSILYDHWLDYARQIRSTFEDGVSDLLYDFSPSPHSPVRENEMYAGTIMGRQNGAQGKPLRDLSKNLRDRFNTLVDYAVLQMTWGEEMGSAEDLDELYNMEGLERDLEALPRAIACLRVAVQEDGLHDPKLGDLEGFKYLLLTVVLTEMDRWRRTTLGQVGPLPRVK